MVFESLLDPIKAEKKPLDNFFLGIFYTSIAILVTLWVFKGQGSLIMVTILVLCSVILMYNVIRLEEQKDKELDKESSILKEHSKAISFFTFLFLGFLVGFALWFTLLPYDQSQSLFSLQLDTISSINSPITGRAVGEISTINSIFYSNMGVILFSVLFSFFFGAGAIFILAWNASVIGTAIGVFIRNNLGVYASKFGIPSIANYMQTFSIGLLKYSIHGIPEVIAYFVASLAGGILSVAIIKHDLVDKNFRKIAIDSMVLFAISLVILYIAAILEVYISPTIA
jgi:stage II sporulation protein M